jgi:hypothetical protein
MATKPKSDDTEVSGAADGGQSEFHESYKDNPDKPDPTSVAQVQVLKDEA